MTWDTYRESMGPANIFPPYETHFDSDLGHVTSEPAYLHRVSRSNFHSLTDHKIAGVELDCARPAIA